VTGKLAQVFSANVLEYGQSGGKSGVGVCAEQLRVVRDHSAVAEWVFLP
jgi:hypothetical protein